MNLPRLNQFTLGRRIPEEGGKKKNLHDWYTNHQYRLPLVPVQRDDGEQALQNGGVEKGEVQCHG